MSIFTDRGLKERYREFLDEVYGTVKIAGYEYDTSRALEKLDPTAFGCGFNDWLDSEIGETLWETKDGEYTDVNPENEGEVPCDD